MKDFVEAPSSAGGNMAAEAANMVSLVNSLLFII
jgi:hypothetical protein